MKELSEKELREFYEKTKRLQKKNYERRNVRIRLLLEKCKESGIIVSEREVDEEMKRLGK